MYTRFQLLVNQIVNLPDVQLTTDQRVYLLKLFRTVPRDAESYLNHLNQLKDIDTNILNTTLISDIKNYLKKIPTLLPSILSELKKVYEELIAGWRIVTNNEELGGDELIPLFIYCLPNDFLTLIKITNRLFFASMFDNPDEEGYILVTIFTCSQKKAEFAQKNEAILRDEEIEKYNEVLHESIRQADINTFKITCQLYIDYLLPFIRHEIEKEPLMKYYCDPKKKFSERIDELVEDFHSSTAKDMFGDCVNNEIFILLFDKIKILTMLKKTLESSISSVEILESCRKILIRDEQRLMQEGNYAYNTFVDKSASLFGAKRYYRLQIWDSHEGSYLKIFKDITENFINLQDEETKNIGVRPLVRV